MAKNGLLNRLQRRLLLLGAASRSSAPGNWPISWVRRSAHGRRAPRCATGFAGARQRNARTGDQTGRSCHKALSGRNPGEPALAQRHPAGGRAHRGALSPLHEHSNRARRAVAKLNLLLLAVLVACAIGLVTSQHRARKLFSDLEREQNRGRELDIDYGRLQLEASTWGLHQRVEKIATGTLGMRSPDPRRVRVVGREKA